MRWRLGFRSRGQRWKKTRSEKRLPSNGWRTSLLKCKLIPSSRLSTGQYNRHLSSHTIVISGRGVLQHQQIQTPHRRLLLRQLQRRRGRSRRQRSQRRHRLFNQGKLFAMYNRNIVKLSFLVPSSCTIVDISFSTDEEEDNVEQQRPKTPPPPPPAPPANTGKGKKPRKKPKTPKFVTPRQVLQS